MQKPVVLTIMDSECAYRGTVSSCRSPILFALTDFSPIMRASIVGGASPQWERAYHWTGSAFGALPYVVKKPVFHIHRALAFEIVDMHHIIPKYVSGATFSLPANLTETGIFVFDIGNKKSVRLDSLKPLACRYRQTPFTERFGEYNIPRLFSYQYVQRQPIFLPLIW